MAFGETYRGWALDHPTQFQLVYGNPIPGYDQPTEVTHPPARRSFALLADVLAGGFETGTLELPKSHGPLPDALEEAFEVLQEKEGHDLPAEALYLAASMWARMHGTVSLELFDLIQPVVGDSGAFYRHELRSFVDELRGSPS